MAHDVEGKVHFARTRLGASMLARLENVRIARKKLEDRRRKSNS